MRGQVRMVLRWDVPVDDDWHPIGNGPVLLVDSRTTGVVTVWTEELLPPAAAPDATVIRTPREARVFGTGQPLPSGAHLHLGSTFDAAGDQLVWHLYAYVHPAQQEQP